MPTKKILTREKQGFKPKLEGISYSQLAKYLCVLFIGIVLSFLFLKLGEKEKIIFSTVDFFNFSFSVAVSSASIVLAIVAISLSKNSERILSDKNDENIRIQNDIYRETSNVLTQIKSSTNVTEKRIEDIISGRVGDAVNDAFPDKKTLSMEERNRLEEQLKKSLTRNPAYLNINSEGEERREYAVFRDSVLNKIEKKKGIIVIKKGDGTFGMKGDKLVDGVFIFKKETKFSVSVFFTPTENDKSIKEYLYDIVKEISAETFHKSFLVFDKRFGEENQLDDTIQKLKDLVSKKVSEQIVFITGSAEDVANQILENLKKA